MSGHESECAPSAVRLAVCSHAKRRDGSDGRSHCPGSSASQRAGPAAKLDGRSFAVIPRGYDVERQALTVSVSARGQASGLAEPTS